ncbi:MAG: tetratricopeptide repeat protein [Acidobacteriota bacterium]
MSRDNAVYLTCGLILGLVIGSLVIGPRVARTQLGAAAAAAGSASGETAGASPAPPAAAGGPAAMGGGPAGGSNSMEAVRKQIEVLKARIASNPDDAEALAQLGNMYMDAGKYPQATDYYERALKLHEDSNLRTDLGICYKESGQMEKSLAAFEQVVRDKPDQWQALFNKAVVLADMKRFDEARSVAAKLKQMRPEDGEVQKLDAALKTAR